MCSGSGARVVAHTPARAGSNRRFGWCFHHQSLSAGRALGARDTSAPVSARISRLKPGHAVLSRRFGCCMGHQTASAGPVITAFDEQSFAPNTPPCRSGRFLRRIRSFRSWRRAPPGRAAPTGAGPGCKGYERPGFRAVQPSCGSTRRLNSRSCSFAGSDGAFIIRSSARWFIGNMMTSRILASSANSITIRSIPAAQPPWGGAPYLNALTMPPNRASTSSLP